MTTQARDVIERRVKIVTAIAAVATVVVGTAQYLRTQSIEAAKPYLQKKLDWCVEAIETTAYIATADSQSRSEKEKRFWQLYWGVMGLVENKNVTDAMIEFGNRLKGLSSNDLTVDSLNLARACREEMANDWSSIWRR